MGGTFDDEEDVDDQDQTGEQELAHADDSYAFIGGTVRFYLVYDVVVEPVPAVFVLHYRFYIDYSLTNKCFCIISVSSSDILGPGRLPLQLRGLGSTSTSYYPPLPSSAHQTSPISLD